MSLEEALISTHMQLHNATDHIYLSERLNALEARQGEIEVTAGALRAEIELLRAERERHEQEEEPADEPADEPEPEPEPAPVEVEDAPASSHFLTRRIGGRRE